MKELAWVVAGTRSSKRGLYSTWFLLLLTLIYASSFVDRIFLSVVGQAVKLEMNLSDAELGVLGGLAFSVFYSALGIPMARLAERYSRVMLISLSIAAWSAMTALCGTAGGFWHLLVYRLGVGIGEAGSTPTAHSLIADQFPEGRRATALALYALGPPIGVLAGAIGGGWAAQHFGWRHAFFAVGLPGIALAVLAWLTLREPRHAQVDAAPPTAVPPLRSVVHLLMSSRTFVQMLLGTVIGAFAQYGINLFLPVYLARVYGMGLAQAGMVFGLIVGVGGIAGNALGGYLSDALGARDKRWYAWVPAIGTLLGFPLAAMAFTLSDWRLAVPLLLGCTIMLNVWNGPTFSIVQGLVTPRMRATASAFVFLLMNLVGQGLGPTTVGLLSDRFAASLVKGGGYQATCHASAAGAQGHAAAGAVSQACTQAAASGLRYALLLMSVVLVWSAWHYFSAARHIDRR